MIKHLEWDSKLLKKNIGEIKDIPINEEIIKAHIEEAKNRSYKYLIIRLKDFQCRELLLLTKHGFYISDIGITLKAFLKEIVVTQSSRYPVREATLKDIEPLKRIIPGLFIQSRFYNDPFFSKRDADLIFSKWIENSIKKEAADIVFIIPKKAFITCKKKGSTGEISLIGVKKGEEGKGLGKALVSRAVEWFKDNQINSIQVRTQLKNTRALNFYESLGFKIDAYDIVMACCL